MRAIWIREPASRREPLGDVGPAGRTVSVVICVYMEGRWNELAAAVESLRKQSHPALELILVVDHNPVLLARARNRFRDALVVENGGPRGLSGARNAGVAASRGDIVAFLDDDATPDTYWLERLLSAYEDESVVGVGGAIQPSWDGGRPAWFPEEFGWVVGCSYRGLPERRAEVRNLIGANMSFRRHVFEDVGYFDCGVGQVGSSMLRCDDTEYCIRLRQRLPCARILYEPSARVYHRVPENRSSFSYFVRRCYTEGLAKAQISDLVGRADGLSSERSYAVGILPRGAASSLAEGFRRGSIAGAFRAAAIVAGLAVTAAGYLYGSIAARL